MKKILISFLISLFFNTYALSIEKIYYCIEIGATGFNLSKNYEQQDFKLERFKVKIDFENEYFSSKDIYMTNSSCSYMISKWGHTMQCTAPYGSMFVINSKNLKFTSFDSIGTAGNNDDDLIISHGKCEEF